MSLSITDCNAQMGVVIVVACLASCGSKDDPTPTAVCGVPEVDCSLMQPQVARALTSARDLVLDQPQSADAWGYYGCLLDAHELSAPAASCYRRAHELDPSEFRWPYLLGTVLEGRELDAEQLLKPFASAERINAQFAPLHHRMGEVLSTRGRLNEAKVAYQRAIQLDHSLAVAHRSLGQALLSLDEPQGALSHLTYAKTLLPDDRTIHASLAMTYRRLGRDGEAEAHASKARASREIIALPDSVKFEVRRMNISLEHCRQRALDAAKQGDVASALNELSPCREVVTSDPYFHFLLGQTLAQIERHDLAIPSLERTLQLRPEFPNAAYALAVSYLATGRTAEAEAPLRSTLQLAPGHAAARARLGTVLMRTGRPTQAIEEFDQAGADAALDHVAEFDWANALAQTGAVDRAIDHYVQAIRLNPMHADSHYNLGVVLERAGRASEATEHFRAAVKIDPNHRAVRRLAGTGPKP